MPSPLSHVRHTDLAFRCYSGSRGPFVGPRIRHDAPGETELTAIIGGGALVTMGVVRLILQSRSTRAVKYDQGLAGKTAKNYDTDKDEA